MSEIQKKVLSALMITGAHSPEKAVESNVLAKRLGIEKRILDVEIETLSKSGYAVVLIRRGIKSIYLTAIGIITASSVYS
jgi:DNA-binding IscR family transcriptional regulator